jgi:CrcB protein
MTLYTFLAIWFGWFLGAISRNFLSWFVYKFFPHSINFWTLIVNSIWSLITWILFWIFFYYSVNIHIKSFLVTWFLWALTTFSTFAIETLFLLDWKEYKYAVLNIFVNVFFTVLCVSIWFYLTKLIIWSYLQ